MAGRSQLALAAALAVGLLLFAALASAVTRGTWVVEVDEDVAGWVARELPTWVEWLARPFSWVGGWVGITVASVGVFAALVAARQLGDAAWLAVAVAGMQVLNAFTKTGYDRPRPDEGSAVPLPSSSSFPSGHASGGIVTAGVLAVLAAERWPHRRRTVWVAAALAAVGIAASRVLLNVHHVSDVVAGLALGGAWLAAFMLLRDAAGGDGAKIPGDGRRDRD